MRARAAGGRPFAEQIKKRERGRGISPVLLSWFESGASQTKKKETRLRLLIMLGYPDSNQERQDQNLQCYHYTIAQYICSKAVQRYCFFT